MISGIYICMKNPVLYLLAIISIFFMAHVSAATEPIIVATDASMYPMEFTGAKGELCGFDIDFMRAVASEAGFCVRFKVAPWRDLLPGLEKGEHDAVISSVILTENRQDKYAFSMPYLNAGNCLVVTEGPEKITCLNDMKEKTIGVLKAGSAAFLVRKKRIETRYYDDIGHALDDLEGDIIQGIACNRIMAINSLKQQKEHKPCFRIVDKPLSDKYYGIVVKKANKGLIKGIDCGIEIVRKKGIDKELEKKWFSW